MPIFEREIKRGDVVVVPFPYSDSAAKRRPALVVSSDEYNARTGHLWVAMITSRGQNPSPDDIILDHEKAGLTVASVARIAKITTIAVERVIRIAGKIDGKTRKDVRRALADIID